MFKYINKSDSSSGNAAAMQKLNYRVSPSPTVTIYCFHVLWSPGSLAGCKCMEKSSEEAGLSPPYSLGGFDFSRPCLPPG